MAEIIGMVCSLLLFRKSMVEGWMYVLKNRRLPPREDEGAFSFAAAVREELLQQNHLQNREMVAPRQVVPDVESVNGELKSPTSGTPYIAKESRSSSANSLA